MKQLLHGKGINSSRKHREKTVRQRPDERRRRRREKDNALIPVLLGLQSSPFLVKAFVHKLAAESVLRFILSFTVIVR